MSGDAYKVGVAIALSSNATQIFGALGQHFLKLDRHLTDFRHNWVKTAALIGGGIGIFGGEHVLKGAIKLIDKGNDLVKIQRDMIQAGATGTQVQEAYAKAWEMTGKYTNISAVEALKMMNDARMTFGDQDKATHHIEDFVQMASFLKAYEGGKHSAHSEGLMREVNAAMKSGEIAGKINPEDMAEHVKQLTAMKIAYGEQVKITQYLTAQRAAGVALRNSSDAFRYGMFPALVQENGSNAGVMLMTAFNKIVAAVGNRTLSLQHMAELGVLNEKDVKYDKTGRAIGLKDPEGIKGSHEAAINFADWVMKTLKPLLDKQTSDPIRQAQLISGMFPDRNVAKAVTEIIQQYTKLAKDAEQMANARSAMNTTAYVDGSWDAQKQSFETQWTNLLNAIGAPMVAVATENLKKLNEGMSGFAGWAGDKENADTIRKLFMGMVDLGGFLVVGGAAAILVALGPAGWLIGALGGLAAALVQDGGFSQDNIDQWLSGLRNLPAELDQLFAELNYKLSFGLLGTAPKAQKPLEDGTRDLGPNPDFNDRWPVPSDKKKKVSYLPDSLLGIAPQPANYLPDNLTKAQPAIYLPDNVSRSAPEQASFIPLLLKAAEQKPEKEKFLPSNFDPGSTKAKPPQIALSLNVDGRALAQVISEQLDALYEHATGAPSYNAQSHFARADGALVGT